MSLTTRPRPGASHKKLKAAHHRHSKTYLKTYWPYLPIVGIITLGLVINHYWQLQGASTPPKLVSYTYYDVLESSIAALALSIFLLRHAFAWHKVLIKEEAFVAKHPVLDISLVSLAVVGLLFAHHGVSLI